MDEIWETLGSYMYFVIKVDDTPNGRSPRKD